MKRLLAVLGVFALLASLFVLASSSPASAGTGSVPAPDTPVDIDNHSDRMSVAVTFTGCGWVNGPYVVAPGTEKDIELPGECTAWDVVAVDEAGICTVRATWGEGRPVGGDDVEADVPQGTPFPYPPGNVLNDTIVAGSQWYLNFNDDDCIRDNYLDVEKVVSDADEWAALQGSFGVTVASASDDVCADSNTSVVMDFNVDSHSHGPGGGWVGTDDLVIEVLNGYIMNNMIVPCVYNVTEDVPAGWTLTDIEFGWDNGGMYDCGGFEEAGIGGDLPTRDLATATATVSVQYAKEECEVDFFNELDPIPLVVTKTFTGRDYYTTVDRADFHLYTPGLCGTFPMDPFGGLLGSVGVFRTINASQLPQVVMALPTIIPAGPAGPCKYRVQENNAPDGCTALDPTGSNADGPYWEQTWTFGETTEMNFNIVNDCAETPEPTPEPSVAPTSTPKKPGAPGAKKPSGGGSTAPKFTG